MSGEDSNTRNGLLSSDLRAVLSALEEAGELRMVEGADWDVELGAITELMALRDGPALLFDRIKGCAPGHRVLANLLNSPRRVALLLGLPADTHPLEVVRELRRRLSSIRQADPLEVTDTPVREEVHRGADVDLWEFATPRWHEHDGGRYIGTGCAVVTRDRDSGWVNLGTYRVQVHDRDTLGLYIQRSHHGALMQRQYWDRGEPCPVAVAIGLQPGLLLGSFLTIPNGVSEYQWSGGLMGQPVQVFPGEVTGLPLPASAEIVLEGFCLPPSVETRLEGPFGETIGYYASGAREEPVIKVERVYHRQNPIIVGAPPLRPPASSSATYLFRAANAWSELERAGVPDVRGVWMHPSGASGLLAIVAIKQRYAGHAKQAGLTLMSGRGGTGLGRFVIVVDDDIDPSDIDQVLWALATRCDPATSIDIVRGMTVPDLDPRLTPAQRAVGDYTTSRAILDACRPFTWINEFPRTLSVSDELRERVLRDWSALFDERPQR
ncbi:MAG: UbiD family decarboxylase [Chloroflexi bacterium]|nr:UbiD family decarboxylase [Chloroflexota bacterium]